MKTIDDFLTEATDAAMVAFAERDALQKRVTALEAEVAHLRKRCTCGSGLADGLCPKCWPQ